MTEDSGKKKVKKTTDVVISGPFEKKIKNSKSEGENDERKKAEPFSEKSARKFEDIPKRTFTGGNRNKGFKSDRSSGEGKPKYSEKRSEKKYDSPGDKGERKFKGKSDDSSGRKPFGERKFTSRSESSNFPKKRTESQSEKRGFVGPKIDRKFGERKERPFDKERDTFRKTDKFSNRNPKSSDAFPKRSEVRDKSPGKPFEEKKKFEPGKKVYRKPVGEYTLGDKRPEYNFSKFENKKTSDGLIRLNKYIADAGVCSRRDADDLIKAGSIKVNGKVVTEVGTKVKPSDSVKYGNRVLDRSKMVYILMNKPKDFITTVDDPDGRRTVIDLLGKNVKERVYPVGRLDRNTTGLLLLTNDGELAEKLSHPSYNTKKVYQVELDIPFTKEDVKRLSDGIMLEDGIASIDNLEILSPSSTELGLELHSGRNRIVRRIFEAMGYNVVKLDRTMFAGLTKKDLPRGTWRYLNEKEVIKLKYLK